MPALLLAGLHGCATQMQMGDQNALVTAATVGDNTKVAKMLGQGVDANIQLNDGTTALFMAAQQGHTDIVTLLLNADANINVRGYRGATPLLIAATTGHTDIVDLLIKRGATVDIPREDHATPLFMAAQGGFVNVVNLLIDAGAYPDKLAYKGATALFIAAQNGHHPVVQALAAKGADVNLGLEDGTTPLLAAALKGHMSVSRVLLEHGARPDTANNRGMTPMLAARQEGHPELSTLLGKALASQALANTETRPEPEIQSDPVVEETSVAVAEVSSGQPVPVESNETRIVTEDRQIPDTNTDTASIATTAAASTTGTTPHEAAVITEESPAGTDQPASGPMQAATVATVSGVPASRDNDNTASVPAPVTEQVTESTAGKDKQVAPSAAASWRPETPASQVASDAVPETRQAVGKPAAPEPTAIAQQEAPQAAPATAASWKPETPASQVVAEPVPETRQAVGKPATPEPTAIAQRAATGKVGEEPQAAPSTTPSWKSETPASQVTADTAPKDKQLTDKPVASELTAIAQEAAVGNAGDGRETPPETIVTRPAEKPAQQASGKTMPATRHAAPDKVTVAEKPAADEKIVYMKPTPPEPVKERSERETVTVRAAPADMNEPVKTKGDDILATVTKPSIKTAPAKQAQEKPASPGITIGTAERADEDSTSAVSSDASKISSDSPVASKTESIDVNVDKQQDKPRTGPGQAPDSATAGTAKTRLAAIELESDDLQVRATTSRKILREEATPAETVKKVIKGLDEDEESGLADTGAATIKKQFTRKNFDANKHVKPMQGNFIVINATDIYTSPQWHASRFRSLSPGRKVEVNGYVQGGKWFRIKYAGGDGYVPVRRLKEIRNKTTEEPASTEISAETLERKVTVLPEGTAEQQYKFAMSMFQLGEYTTAVQAFSEFVELHPHDSKAPSAIYWQGMSYYVKQNYSQAASSFMLLYKSFPRDNRAAESLLKLSNSLHALGKQEAACTTLEQLRNEYPGSYLRLKREIYTSGADAGCS